MLMCQMKPGCQRLHGHSGECLRWDEAHREWAPLDQWSFHAGQWAREENP